MTSIITSKIQDIKNHTQQLAQQLETLGLAVEALNGIGNMLDIAHSSADETMSAQRSDAAAVFKFFSSVMREPMRLAFEKKDYINIALYQAAQSQGECHE